MVSPELLASVDALSADDRLELLAHLEDGLYSAVIPTKAQQAAAEGRLAQMKADPSIGLTLEESIATARAIAR
ncbi:hypothetical protein [Nocardioides sp.]|uniref:hypothetical protein n=1 Tax=Nocardioides sp. TaxID=35761 RepID=UPI0039E6A6C2